MDLGNHWIDGLLRVAMFSLMFAMGLALTVADFRRIVRAPTATLVGTVLQLIVMPLVGITLGRLYELPILLTAGLVVLAACPGGMFSNMFVHVSRGHTALSITLTATATLVTLFTLPLWVRFVLGSGGGVEAEIEMPVLETALQLGLLTILPVAIGMAVRHRWPQTTRWERRLSLMAMVGIVVGVVIQGASRPDPPVQEFATSLAPVAWYLTAAIGLGTLVPVLFGITARDAVTIAVEMVVKNTLLGIVLVSQALPFEALVPIFIYMIVQTPAAVAVIVSWRLLARFGVLEAVPAHAAATEAVGEIRAS